MAVREIVCFWFTNSNASTVISLYTYLWEWKEGKRTRKPEKTQTPTHQHIDMNNRIKLKEKKTNPLIQNPNHIAHTAIRRQQHCLLLRRSRCRKHLRQGAKLLSSSISVQLSKPVQRICVQNRSKDCETACPIRSLPLLFDAAALCYKLARHSLCHSHTRWPYDKNQNSTSPGRRSPNFEAQSTSEMSVHFAPELKFDLAGTSICHPVTAAQGNQSCKVVSSKAQNKSNGSLDSDVLPFGLTNKDC